MAFDFTVVADTRCTIGECPRWHADEECLYWTDIPEGRLYKYDPETGDHQRVYDGRPVGGFTIQEDGSLLLCMAEKAVAILRDGELQTVIEGTEGERRFNDVIAGPAGRVYCGLFPTDEKPGALCRLNTDGELQELFEVAAPNGMGFTLDEERLYVTDSGRQSIYRYDYQAQTGKLTNQRVFYTLENERTYNDLPEERYPVPDGMTVDDEGHVWSCLFGGEGLLKLSQDGEELQRVETPVKSATSLSFGGGTNGDIYVTTAQVEQYGAGTDDEDAGKLLRTHPTGIQGQDEYRSAVLI